MFLVRGMNKQCWYKRLLVFIPKKLWYKKAKGKNEQYSINYELFFTQLKVMG